MNFLTGNRIPLIWGSGHTVESDPIPKGWRCRKIADCQVWVVGQRGKGGCASIRLAGRYGWDVALYLETPKEVDSVLKGGGFLDARFVQIPDVPGFGLEIIREIESERGCESSLL